MNQRPQNPVWMMHSKAKITGTGLQTLLQASGTQKDMWLGAFLFAVRERGCIGGVSSILLDHCLLPPLFTDYCQGEGRYGNLWHQFS